MARAHENASPAILWLAFLCPFTIRPSAATEMRVSDVATDPTSASVFYVATSQCLFRTVDGGGSWTRLTSGLPGSYGAERVEVVPYRPTTLFTVIYSSTHGGIYRSTDGGGHWRRFESGLDDNVMMTGFGFAFGEHPTPKTYGFAIDPFGVPARCLWDETSFSQRLRSTSPIPARTRITLGEN